MIREVPFVRLLIPLIAGILCHRYCPFPISLPVGAWIAATLVLLVLAIRPLPYARRHMGGILVALALFMLGYGLQVRDNSLRQSCHFSAIGGEDGRFRGLVSESEDRGEWYRLTVEVTGRADSAGWQTTCGLMQLYLAADPAKQLPEPGQYLIWQGRLQAVRGPDNPKAFDYRQHLANRHIHHQSFLRKGFWRVEPVHSSQSLLSRAKRARTWCRSRISQHVSTTQDRGVALALVLGDKGDLTNTLSDAYAGTGAMHILAVSGLHVGLVYIILQFLVRICLPAPHLRRWMTLIVVTGGVWSYALLTGASPSALRAATMFGFVAFGAFLRRGSSIYNTLAASAFVLLCISPSLLWQVGFQLSYLAVTGIVFFQPILYKLWTPPHKLLDYVWSLITVSISAQLTTFPLSLHIFQQFPLLFWLSGLVAVPAATLMLTSGLLTLLLELTAPTGAFVPGTILETSVHFTNQWINGLMNLPIHHVREIAIDSLATWMLYGSLGALAAALAKRSGRWLILCLCLVNCVIVRQYWLDSNRRSIQMCCMYSTREGAVIDYFRNGWRYTLSTSSVDPSNERYATRSFRLWMGAKNTSDRMIFPEPAGWFQIGNILCLRITAENHLPAPNCQPDWLLIGGQKPPDPEGLLAHCTPRQILLESDLPWQARTVWKSAADRHNIECHDISSDGAWLFDYSSPYTPVDL